MRSVLAVLLVLAGASAVLASSPMLLKEWLSAQKSGTAHPAYYKSEAETVHACLRTIAFQDCNTFDRCGIDQCPTTMGYIETKLGCCHGHGYGYDYQTQETFKAAKTDNIGSCWWTVSYFDALTATDTAGDRTGSLVVGTFDVTCELKDEAEKCGDDFCDDLVLKAWGQIHEAHHVAIEGRPTAEGTDTCALRSRPIYPARKATAASNAELAATQASEHYYSTEVQYFDGTATVYAGHVDTYSCSHNVKVQEGHFQAVLDYVVATDAAPIAPSPGQFIVRPFTIDMKLKKAGHY